MIIIIGEAIGWDTDNQEMLAMQRSRKSNICLILPPYLEATATPDAEQLRSTRIYANANSKQEHAIIHGKKMQEHTSCEPKQNLIAIEAP